MLGEEEELESSEVTVLRIGCDRSTNTLFIQYRRKSEHDNSPRTKRIRLKKCSHEVHSLSSFILYEIF